MEREKRIVRGEGGQVLVLFALMIITLMLFMIFTVDAGFLMVTRRVSQTAVDAAALAGAQELPDDRAAAEQMARDYARDNGIDPDDLVITFECTSTNVFSCNAAENKYDTIAVSTRQQSPAFFGPLLNFVGAGDSCWTDGCHTSVLAAACRGSCGAGSTPVDVVLAIDHTRSMSTTDLANAKSGARTFMEAFDDQTQRLGLAVTPPVSPTDHCDTINNWNDPQVWLPVPLTDDYQSAPHVLNAASALVTTSDCLDLPTTSELSGSQTNLGEPLKAALQELQANGRAGARFGIVLETDGAANVMNSAAAAAIGATGPCDYAAKIAQQIKDQGIELYTIAYGADDRCTQDPSGTYWHNRPATELLTSLATDADHSFVEPRSSDLDAIFQAIGEALAAVSRLIR